MNEKEYIITTNRVRVSDALTIMRGVLPGIDYGISMDEFNEIFSRLSRAEDKLINKIEEYEQ